MMTSVRKKAVILTASTLVVSALAFAYFTGPTSELTLLSRLHYNTLFIYTPCLSGLKTYDDGAIKFNYRQPPALLSHTPVLFVDPLYLASRKHPFADALEAISLEISTGYAYKFKLPPGPLTLPPPKRTIKLKKGLGEVRNWDPSYNDYGPEHLHLYGKNGYVYEIELPFYLERIGDRTLLFAALHHSGVLSLIMPGSFSDYMPPRGFFKWFFTPCADKQLYYSGKAMLESLEISD